jgi:hypothetical protein
VRRVVARLAWAAGAAFIFGLEAWLARLAVGGVGWEGRVARVAGGAGGGGGEGRDLAWRAGRALGVGLARRDGPRRAGLAVGGVGREGRVARGALCAFGAAREGDFSEGARDARGRLLGWRVGARGARVALRGGLDGRVGTLLADLAGGGSGVGREGALRTGLARDGVRGREVTGLARLAGGALISGQALVLAGRVQVVVRHVEAVVGFVLTRGLGAARGVCAAVVGPVTAEGQLGGARADGALLCGGGEKLVR